MPCDDIVFRPPGSRRAAPVYSEEGVDLTLVRRSLSLTPAERLQELQDFVTALEEIRNHQATWTSEASCPPS